jgi:hypothetical protein
MAALVSTGAHAQVNSAFVLPVAAPTLSEIGLGLLVVGVGAIAGYVVRRKR